MVDFSGFDTLDGDEQQVLLNKLERAATNDSGDAVRELLNMGQAVYYSNSSCNENQVIKEYPNGRKTRITMNVFGIEIDETNL